MVRVRDSPVCAVCEFVMKELEERLEDQATEVGTFQLHCYDGAVKLYKAAGDLLLLKSQQPR